jgi:hypothetical protein
MYVDDDAAPTMASSSSCPITAPPPPRTNAGYGNFSHPSRAATAPAFSGNGNGGFGCGGGVGGDSQNVRVVARVRPLSRKEHESERSAESIIVNDDMSSIVMPGTGGSRGRCGAGDGDDERKFVFDAVLGPTSTQTDVYERACGDMIPTSIFRGYNATIIAYGQTGSGKTYTMGTDGGSGSALRDGTGAGDGGGGPSSAEGVISRAVYDLFRARDELPNGGERIGVTMSYLEI